MAQEDSIHSIQNGGTEVLIRIGNDMPEILHWGSPLDGIPSEGLLGLGIPQAALAAVAPISLIPEESRGFPGRPGLIGHRRSGNAWSPRFSLQESRVQDTSLTVVMVDPIAELELVINVSVTSVGTMTAEAVLTNTGDSYYLLHGLSLTLPLPAEATDLQTFSGRWCNEFQVDRTPLVGVTHVENRRGRTSHERLPAVFAGSSGFNEATGSVWGAQLAWSGNFSLVAEQLADGRRFLQLGELLLPGELALRPGEAYDTPQLVATWSAAGLTPASQKYHQHVRTVMRDEPLRPRPVILNTWEAVYFNHNLATLVSLADAAAEVGVERFVLDDGWFGGRRNDEAGLGDWWVSRDVWPGGLHPITSHVVEKGMEFGLWVEPEMVNPDSDLFRLHPDWALTTEGYEPLLGRHQLVLDFGRSDVRQYLFEHLDGLLKEYPIRYLKWDMNRVLVQGSGATGAPGVHDHVRGLYEVLSDIRAAHPDVEIESCASGGGRIDLGILQHTERVWTSDCNDALDRQYIQRGASMLIPPEVMGSHIGPSVSHTTGRSHQLGIRAASAFFGHLGIEWNLLQMNADERALLADVVALHKEFRPLLHSGSVVRLDHPDPSLVIHGVIASDASEAILSVAAAKTSGPSALTPVVVHGLDPAETYTVKVLELGEKHTMRGQREPSWMSTGGQATGAALATIGIALPVMWPETALLIHAVGAGRTHE